MAGRQGGTSRGAKGAGRPKSKQSNGDSSENEDTSLHSDAAEENASEEEASNDESSKESTSDTAKKAIKTEKVSKAVSFDCSMCFFTTDNDVNFLKHIEELHRRDMGFWCKACGSAYEESTQLIEHIRELCDKVKHFQHACGFSTCDFKTSDPANLIFHFRNEHKGKYLFPCGQCEQQFTILTSLVLHQQQKCTNKEMCAITSAGEVGQPRPKPAEPKKKESVSSERRFRCSLCTFETIQQTMFVEHHTDLHVRDLCCCKQCGKVYKNAEHLANHIDENDCTANQYDHPCGTEGCDFTTHDPLVFRNHIRNGHNRTSLHKCSGCKKQFTIIPLLIMHMQEECPELNIEGRKSPRPSNGNRSAVTVNNAAGNSSAAAPEAASGSQRAKRGASSRGRGRGRGKAKEAATSSPKGRKAQKRGRPVATTPPGSSEESEVDDPDLAPAPTRVSSRVSKKITYANPSDSEEDAY